MPSPNNDDVRVTTPGGFGLSIHGRDTILILLLIGALAWTGYTTMRGFERMERVTTEQREARDIIVKAFSEEHREILCILALDQAERKTAVRSGNVCGFLLGGQHPR